MADLSKENKNPAVFPAPGPLQSHVTDCACGEAGSSPLVIEYTDPVEGFRGWFVRASLDNRLCAGGFRVQAGLCRSHLERMALNMSRKMRLAGLHVDGAKSGIDRDPARPGRAAAIARFLQALRPYLESSYSMGPDLNVSMEELESIGRSIGLPSVKVAIAQAQGLTPEQFDKRYRVLDGTVDGWPLARLRTGYGVAAAALPVLDYLGIPRQQARIGLQGVGAVGKAALFGLVREGAQVVALADAERCICCCGNVGLTVAGVLSCPSTTLAGVALAGTVAERDRILTVECDLLVLAAVENAITAENAHLVRARAVVPGANLAVSADGARELERRGVLVLPDFLCGCGGSLAMQGIFAPVEEPAAEEVLLHVERRMAEMVFQVLERSRRDHVSPIAAGLQLCREYRTQPGARPYGGTD